MIQIKRGSSTKWKNCKTPLANGQPGYDKTKHKLKVGDGVTKWPDLPYASGLFEEEILEESSKATNDTLFTYGTSTPSSTTKGKVYLQKFDGAIEADFVVETGRNVNYFYRKWNSGFIECWGSGNIPSSIDNKVKTTIFKVTTSNYFEVKGFWK